MKTEIKFIYRGSAGHWDVYSNGDRLYAIRGDPGKVCVRREDICVPDADRVFKSCAEAMTWVCLTLGGSYVDG